MVLIIEDNCEKKVLKFRLISCDKNYSKFIISFTTLCLKITKNPLQKISLIKKRFLIILPTTCHNDPQIFSFDLSEISMMKLFDSQFLHGKSKHQQTTFNTIVVLMESFPTIPRAHIGVLWFGRSQCDKEKKLHIQNKQTIFINRQISYLRCNSTFEQIIKSRLV